MVLCFHSFRFKRPSLIPLFRGRIGIKVIGNRVYAFGLVFQKVETLVAIKSKFLVARQKSKPLGDGMCYDDVIAGVMMILCVVKCKARICEHCTLGNGKDIYHSFLFHGKKHFFCRLPILGQEFLVIERHNQFTGCLGTYIKFTVRDI